MILNTLKSFFFWNSQTSQSCKSSNDALAITMAIIIVGILIWYIFKYDGTKKTFTEIKQMLRDDIDVAYTDIVGNEDINTLIEMP